MRIALDPYMLRHAGDLVTQVHLADSFDHRASSGPRCVVNPPGSTDLDALFAGLAEIGFDGILTSCVFAWEERAEDSSRSMRRAVDDLVRRHFG